MSVAVAFVRLWQLRDALIWHFLDTDWLDKGSNPNLGFSSAQLNYEEREARQAMDARVAEFEAAQYQRVWLQEYPQPADWPENGGEMRAIWVGARGNPTGRPGYGDRCVLEIRGTGPDSAVAVETPKGRHSWVRRGVPPRTAISEELAQALAAGYLVVDVNEWPGLWILGAGPSYSRITLAARDARGD